MNTHKIAWLTDIHLNFLETEARKIFYQSINETSADAILITGDIAVYQKGSNLASLIS